MKKTFCVLFSLILLLFAGCSGNNSTEIPSDNKTASFEQQSKIFEQPFRGDFEIRDGLDNVIVSTDGLKSVGAVLTQNNNSDSYVLELVFTDDAASRFTEYTKEHIGETTYVYVDGELISEPMIMETINSAGIYISTTDSSYEYIVSIAEKIKNPE